MSCSAFCAHACRLVEERRDDPVTDWMLQVLETACAELARGAKAEAEVRE